MNPTSSRKRFFIAIILSAFCFTALLFMKGFFVSNAQERDAARDPAVDGAMIATGRDDVSGKSGSSGLETGVLSDNKPETVAATFTVTRSDDIAERGTCAPGDCTLREAIIAANNTAGTDTITFAAGLNGVPITLTQTGADPAEDFADYGDLDIRESVIITGNGNANTIIQAGASAYGGIDKIFGINPDCSGAGPSISVTMTDLTIRNGHNAGAFNAVQFNHTGGAIDYCGGGSGTNALTMTNVIVRDNQVDQGSGGGLNISGVSTGTTNVTLTNTQFLNNKTLDASHVSTGAGANITLNTSSASMTVNIDGCTFDNNEAQNSSGGGLEIVSNISAANTGILNIHNSLFNNNRAKGAGGGIDLNGTSGANGKIIATIDQGTVIKNNVTGFNSGTSFGGGMHIEMPHTSSVVSLSKISIINNSESATAVTKLGGAGISVGTVAGTAGIQFSRIAGNTLGGGAGVGSGVRKDNQAGTFTAANNWWGCSGGPSAAPCDTAVLVAGSGALTSSPFLRIKTTPSPASILTNQTSAITSRVQDSTGADTAVSNLDVFVNTNANAGSPLPITWSSVGGTLSGQQSPIQSSGGFAQATATYTATAANASNSATAKIDNDTTTGNTNTGSITVGKADTSIVINSDNPDPSVIGTGVTVNYTFSITNAPSSPTVPSGNITISDGVDSVGSCSAALGTNNCNITLNTFGARTITATYTADGNFNGSTNNTSHTVVAPDLTAVKTDSVSGTTTLGNTITWTTALANPGNSPATFTSGQTIFLDNMPNSNINYGAATTNGASGISGTGTINCAVASSNLTCTASGGTVIFAAGATINVAVTGSPSAIGTYANPRGGGICRVDSSNNILEGNAGATAEINNDCSDTVVITAPDLTAIKTNNVSNATFLGNTWTWTVRVANAGNANGIFLGGQTILSDNLPNANISYGATSITNVVNVTNSGNISCSIVANDLTCMASGLVTIGATTGRFDVNFTATPTAAGAGAIANPRSAGACSVDPNNLIAESSEGNNACSNTVTVTAANPVYSDPAGTCGGNSPCFTSIQSAIDNVAAAGTVNVGAGTYAESPDLNRAVVVNINGNISITGLTFSSGTLNGLAATISDSGDWNNNGGTFNPGTGTVSFTGTSGTQTIGGSTGTTFNNLTLNNSGTEAAMSRDQTVNGLLNIVAGNLNAGAFTLTVGTAGTSSHTSGQVLGNLKKNFGGAGSFTFPVGTSGQYTPLDVTINSGVGSLTAKANTGVAPLAPIPLNSGTTLHRYWSLSGTGINANIVFQYLAGDVFGTEANYRVIRVSGGSSAVRYPNDASTFVTPASHTFTVNGLTTFSDWTAGEAVAPTAASVPVAGRVITPDGRGIGGSIVIMQDENGNSRQALTNPFGYYNFPDVQAGRSYTLTVTNKQYLFSTSIITVQDELTNVDFIGVPRE